MKNLGLTIAITAIVALSIIFWKYNHDLKNEMTKVALESAYMKGWGDGCMEDFSGIPDAQMHDSVSVKLERRLDEFRKHFILE